MNDVLIDWDYFEKVFIYILFISHLTSHPLTFTTVEVEVACSMNANSNLKLTVPTNLPWYLNFIRSSFRTFHAFQQSRMNSEHLVCDAQNP